MRGIRITRLFLSLLLLAFAAPALAGGSFPVEDIKPLLDRSPALSQWLAASLDLDEVGDATRIGQNLNPRLGGQRVGPYRILAKPKGAPGPFLFELTLDTKLLFRNAAGKKTTLNNAHSVEETLESISLRPYSE